MGVLLELAFRAGIELEDVVAMTSAQLTSGFLPIGILPTAGSALGVAVSDAPLATVMSARALDREVPLTQRPAGVQKGVWWDAIWAAEMTVAPRSAKARGKGSAKWCRAG